MSKNKKFQKALKQERGITLIALVITIVILIILATIAIRGQKKQKIEQSKEK